MKIIRVSGIYKLKNNIRNNNQPQKKQESSGKDFQKILEKELTNN